MSFFGDSANFFRIKKRFYFFTRKKFAPSRYFGAARQDWGCKYFRFPFLFHLFLIFKYLYKIPTGKFALYDNYCQFL